MDRRQRLLRRLPLVGGAIAVALLVGLFVWGVHLILAGKNNKVDRKVQVIQVIRPPPPPPEERPPPPPPDKPEEVLPRDEPEPTPADAPAAEQLGLDAEGSAGGDAFGLAARKGGHDITGSGGAVFAWYTGRLKDQVLDRLSSDARLRSKRYSVAVKVWIERDGRIREVKLATTTGSRELDAAIESALARLPKMAEPPPLEMPQPISLKIVSNI